ncbi:MAG: aminoacyl-tRNA deacylase [Bacteroidetes bacterium]|nr:aminoacyl-tRNA deacylase [Bacteroidota bacterium]
MQKPSFPVTPAIRVLRDHQIPFVPHEYPFEEKGGTRHSSNCLGVDEHQVIKTIILEDENKNCHVVLMHGDKEISQKGLARFINVKQLTPAPEPTATKATGYQFGGTSPFGTRKVLPVYAESTLFLLDRIYINGGKRGFLIEMNPSDIKKVLPVTEVSVGI